MKGSRRRWLLALLAAGWIAAVIAGMSQNPRTTIPYSVFRSAVAQGLVVEVTISDEAIDGKLAPDTVIEGKKLKTFHTVRVRDDDLYGFLQARGVRVTGDVPSRWGGVAVQVVMTIIMVGLFWFLMRGAMPRTGGTTALTFGASKAKIFGEKDIAVRFDDVAGVDEAKDELVEVIGFLRDPGRFTRLGGKVPKGILLVGPPGTGKTLLARAVAGEAGVPFYSISGSEFVEMFVGVGAARVRDLFNQARQSAPCIVFIDELDALGKARGMGPGAHEEREQTLNQLLVELDGFDPRGGVILMAATNRPEILDPALLRAGRFDRHVLVDRPDRGGRLAILKVHARKVPLANEADLETLAAMTAGFVGADLANAVNEAALLAARRGADAVEMADLQEAVERVVAGLEKKNRVLTAMEKERVAFHELGHAVTTLMLPGLDGVQKVSIIPRGIAALGYTLQLPTEDRFLMTQRELEDKIAMLLGGRVAEELIFGEPSTGAQDDLVKATDIARSMVRSYGMSPKLGHVSFDRAPRFLGVNGGAAAPELADVSEEVREALDGEVRRILDEQHARVTKLLGPMQPTLRRAAAELLKKETLTGEELRRLVREPSVTAPYTLPAAASSARG